MRLVLKLAGPGWAADGPGASMAGVDQGLLFLVDVDGQRVVGVEAVAEEDAEAARGHVARAFREVGAEPLRADEHSSYQGIVSEGRHRLCLTHWGKSQGKRARDLLGQAEAEGRRLEVETLKRLLELLRQRPRPPEPLEELEAMVQRYLPCRRGLWWKINQLLQHVERTWSRVSADPKDATNNTTERLIGLTYKIRTRTMRGFKSLAKVLDHPRLASLLRGVDGVCDLRQIV